MRVMATMQHCSDYSSICLRLLGVLARPHPGIPRTAISTAWSLSTAPVHCSASFTSSSSISAGHRSTQGAGSCADAPRRPSLWQQIRAVLMPVGGTEAASRSSRQALPPHTVQAVGNQHQARAVRPPHTPVRSSPGQQLKPSTERLIGNLLKASLVFISFPLFASVLLEQVLLPGMLRGLKSQHDSSKEKALVKIQNYVVLSRVAAKLVVMDGVVLLMNMLSQPQSPGVMQELIGCLEHLATFEPSKKELLMGGVVDKLEHALQKGWVPQCSQQQAYTLYLDLHAARRMQLQETYGQAYQSPPTKFALVDPALSVQR